MGADSDVIEAAGGVLWRAASGSSGVEVALVHRPKYDDWSVPKGKLRRDEHPLLAAAREVAEETGCTGVLGRPMQEVHYLKDGLPKRVRYWAMEMTGGAFKANDEVDRLMWLPPREAQAHVLAERDGPVLKEFAEDHRATRAMVVVRHGSAGSRDTWQGEDQDRPLDELGHAQAELLTDVLGAYGIVHAYSADTLRCLDTVGPFAARFGIPIESEPLLSESGYAAHPDAALERLMQIFSVPEPAVISTQRQVLPLFQDVAKAYRHKRDADFALRKGGFLVFHLTRDDKPRVLALESFLCTP
jgi:8-oxo-dGTP pyrophosphatase MutT (NUDIX family)/phosphohistidine phosphatase SixA